MSFKMIGTKGMKRQVTFLVGLILISSLKAASYYQNHEKGWHWYEPQEVEVETEKKQEPAVAAVKASDAVSVRKAYI